MSKGVEVSGLKLSALRRQSGMSQDVLADRAGVAKRSIARYEAGEGVSVRYAQFNALVQVLKCRGEDLMITPPAEDREPTVDLTVRLVRTVYQQLSREATKNDTSVREWCERVLMDSVVPTVEIKRGRRR